MATVRRFDSTKLPKAEKTREGFLRAPMSISRVGIYEYADANGKITRELRLPEDVFDPESLASFSMNPITDNHPASGSVTSENARELQRGHLSENIRADEDRGVVEALGMITDGDLVEKVESGKADELSAGYTCEIVDASETEWGQAESGGGEHPTYGAFDVQQKRIRGNHVAVVTVGRAGPDVRVRLDAGDAASVVRRADNPGEATSAPADTVQEVTMKITIRGASVEVPDTIAALFDAERNDAASVLAARDATIATLTTERDAEKKTGAELAARADSLGVRVAKLDAFLPLCFGRMCYAGSLCCQACPSKAECAGVCCCTIPGDPPSGTVKVDGKDAPAPAPNLKDPAHRADAFNAFSTKILDGARSRADLEQFAKAVGVEVKTDAADLDVKRACAEKLSGLKLDGKTPEYVGALFDVERTRFEAKPTGSTGVVIEKVDAKPEGEETTEKDARARRGDMARRDSEAWKKPAPGAVTK